MGEITENVPGSYDGDGSTTLEAIWGDGFLSPGGAGEVSRIVGSVPIAGRDVLDIGCGTGGAAIALAREHHARSVVGIDVERYVIEEANKRALDAALASVVQFQTVDPGPLPFVDSSFDVIFSKDSILHIEGKLEFYADVFRVLRPGGSLCVGDWFRGERPDLDAEVASFIAAAGEDFYMQTLGEAGAVASSVGFENLELVDRCSWYHEEAKRELGDLMGSMRESYISRFSESIYEGTAAFWEVLVDMTGRGVLRPGHVRAQKPAN